MYLYRHTSEDALIAFSQMAGTIKKPLSFTTADRNTKSVPRCLTHQLSLKLQAGVNIYTDSNKKLPKQG